MKQSSFITSSLLSEEHGFGTIKSGLPPLSVVSPELLAEYPLASPASFSESKESGGEKIWQIHGCPVQAMKQVHGTEIHIVRQGDALLKPFSKEGDGVATDRSDIVAAIVTADCAPVLLAGKNEKGGNVVAAVHAGWLGAVKGVIESGIKAVKSLGAQEIVAAIGPCIVSSSYEIDKEMYDKICDIDHKAEPWLHLSKKEGKFFFDLPGYCHQRLVKSGIGKISLSGFDTCSDSRLWSYRGESLKGNQELAQAGRQFSFIKA